MQKKSTSSSGFLNSRVLVGLLLCAATACFILIPIRSGLAFLHPQAPSNPVAAGLTFEERVSYQRAIEDVYWRHRIWPRDRGERPDPKPSLDAVMSQAQLEKKVTDYLRKSQALEDYWQRPITSEQLQGEMDRMAKHTKQPEVLRDLFQALGNDPFVIAECLARPALAERLVTNWYAYDQTIDGALRQRAEAELRVHKSVQQIKQLDGTYSEVEFTKSHSARQETANRAETGVSLNSHDWDITVEKLARILDGGRHPVATGVSPAKTLPITEIKVGIISPLQEDETRYYVTAVIAKTDDRLRLATVAWSKEALESWQDRSGTQIVTAMPALAAS